MNIPAGIRTRYELILREPLGATVDLRKQVKAFVADLHARSEADAADLDLERIDAIAESLEEMLKRVSRKTTPLHHRLIHATARFCTMGPEEGRRLDDERFALDVVVVNETARVIRRPEVAIAARA